MKLLDNFYFIIHLVQLWRAFSYGWSWWTSLLQQTSHHPVEPVAFFKEYVGLLAVITVGADGLTVSKEHRIHLPPALFACEGTVKPATESTE